MFTHEEHLDNLIRHISLVREACTLLGRRLIAQGRKEFGRQVIARGFGHDASKFQGIEWDYLHTGPAPGGVISKELELAVRQHVMTNSHHPEFHGGIEKMEELDVAEMVCDWYARAQEFGTGVREWIKATAVDRFKIDLEGKQWQLIQAFLDLLLKDSFTR